MSNSMFVSLLPSTEPHYVIWARLILISHWFYPRVMPLARVEIVSGIVRSESFPLYFCFLFYCHYYPLAFPISLSGCESIRQSWGVIDACVDIHELAWVPGQHTNNFPAFWVGLYCLLWSVCCCDFTASVPELAPVKLAQLCLLKLQSHPRIPLSSSFPTLPPWFLTDNLCAGCYRHFSHLWNSSYWMTKTHNDGSSAVVL